jgi:3-oxoacyl-(acyl-carrier-protein) synthase
MKIAVRGIGWLTKDAYGRVARSERFVPGNAPGPGSLAKKGIFAYPVKNFGRFDRVSRMTCCAVALALADAGISYSATRKQDIGIIGTNAEGSLRTDLEYFKDYIESGRTLSRGNLFIYTLPSSPLGEAAIHFGFRGPLLYAGGGTNSFVTILETASQMILAGETPIMLAGRAEEDEAVYFVLEGYAGRDRSALCDLSAVQTMVRENPDVAALVQRFSFLEAGKA